METNRYNLRAADEETMTAMLLAAGVIDQWGNQAPDVTLDVLGTIYQPTGEVREVDGVQQPVAAPISGWHANMIATLTLEQEEMLPLIPPPKRPYRVFAGE